MTEVQAHRLGKSYGTHQALAEASFALGEGRVTALVGANGSGKTTLIKRMLELTSGCGAATFDGRRYSELDHPVATVGVTFDAFQLDPRGTARAHLERVRRRASRPVGSVLEMLHNVGLEHVADDRIGTYSMGMRQRLTLAAALVASPSVLILDEPGNGMDPAGLNWLRELARLRAREGCSVLLSSHLLSDVEACADDLMVLDRGRLVFDGSLRSFLRPQGDDVVIVRCSDPDSARAQLRHVGVAQSDLRADGTLRVVSDDLNLVAHAVLASGARLFEIRPEQTSLTDAYFDFIGRTVAPEGVADVVA